MLLVS